ncbi:MAG: isoprenylcysteine carboxylmethyltransferase family protein [Alphaproteobacteria bacterium]|nr:isoprenylcysteine carboxylmethyltransferase family protein [Alphaproteobacteria bacterium]
MGPFNAIYVVWGVWLVSWLVAAFWASPAIRRPGLTWHSFYRIPEVLGFALLLGYGSAHRDRRDGWHLHGPGAYTAPDEFLWNVPPEIAWLMVGMAAAGFLFAWWARLYLGRLWSGNVTRKADHRVVDTGPYRLVRHPIYTGILIAAIATVVARPSIATFAGAILLLIGLWIKALLEERFLRRELGAEAYDAYARRTPMLVPLLKL